MLPPDTVQMTNVRWNLFHTLLLSFAPVLNPDQRDSFPYSLPPETCADDQRALEPVPHLIAELCTQFKTLIKDPLLNVAP